VFVTGLLTLAALNKLRLVPAFAGEQAAAASSLRRSIAAEILLASAIFTATAALTTLVSPDGLE
jgi:putative copper resistance protein D